jgi:hypothetical protein
MYIRCEHITYFGCARMLSKAYEKLSGKKTDRDVTVWVWRYWERAKLCLGMWPDYQGMRKGSDSRLWSWQSSPVSIVLIHARIMSWQPYTSVGIEQPHTSKCSGYLTFPKERRQWDVDSDIHLHTAPQPCQPEACVPNNNTDESMFLQVEYRVFEHW